MALIVDLSPQGPLVAFDVALNTVRQATRMLSSTLAVDFLRAGEAADVLRRALAFATSAATVMGLSPHGEAARQLDDVRAIAESMLALVPGPGMLALSPGPTIGDQIALLRMRLGSLECALARLRTALKTASDEVTTSIAHVLGWSVAALPGALHGASEDLQLITDMLRTIRATSRGEVARSQLEAARRSFHELALRHRFDAELFMRARNAVCDTFTRTILTNVAMMITLATREAVHA